MTRTAKTQRTLALVYQLLGYSEHDAVRAEMAASERTAEDRLRSLEIEARVASIFAEPRDPSTSSA